MHASATASAGHENVQIIEHIDPVMASTGGDMIVGARGALPDPPTEPEATYCQKIHDLTEVDGTNDQSTDCPKIHDLTEVDGTNDQSMCTPKIGMAFESEDAAYDFYNSYAGKIGFSIRKSHSKLRRDGTICLKHMVCSNEGRRDTHSSHETIKENATTRSACNSRVQFSISRDGIWTVQKVVLEHNHYLASPDKRHMLRSQRRVLESDKLVIGQMREAGIKPTEAYNFLKQWYGGPQHVPFLRMDCNNHFGRERKKYLEVNDAQTLLEFLKNKQLEDPSFFYAIQLDESCQIANFFWADGQAIVDYAIFGDALSFDTTFNTNKFQMPFAPLLGTNHHKQTILFGAVLLCDETTESFIWLFNTFLTAMSGKPPVTIFTDQCAAMSKAIGIVFPTTKHRLCLWHIYQNAAKHLSHVISNHPRFLSEFQGCVYEERSVAYFETKWKELLRAYNLQGNTWLKNIYVLREKWATIYRRDSFCADMTSTQRSEGMNNVFNNRFRKKLSLSELLVEYEKCAANLRENELNADFKSRKSEPITCIQNLPMLKTAAESYTRRLYSDFEEEFKDQFSIMCKLVVTNGTIKTYKVVGAEFEDEAEVIFDSEGLNIACSCRKYESIGLLCKHTIRVFNINEVFTLPSQYILHRWTKYAKRGFFSGKQGGEEETLQTHAARISRKATSVALKCSIKKELLVDLEEAINKLDLEADNALTDLGPDKHGVVASNTNECSKDIPTGIISFKIPKVIKGPMIKRSRDAIEKRTTKKTSKEGKKGQQRRRVTRDSDVGQDSSQLIGSLEANTSANITVPHFIGSNILSQDSSTMQALLIRGEYTNLLLAAVRDHEQLPTSRTLNFEEQ